MDTKEKLDELMKDTIAAATKKTIPMDEACERAYNLGRRWERLDQSTALDAIIGKLDHLIEVVDRPQ